MSRRMWKLLSSITAPVASAVCPGGEGPGRILCLIIIILLNLALFGLTAKENASLEETSDINTKAFTKWEQFFRDSEIRYAQGINDAE